MRCSESKKDEGTHAQEAKEGRARQIPEEDLADGLQQPGKDIDSDKRYDRQFFRMYNDSKKSGNQQPAEIICPRNTKIATRLCPTPKIPVNHLWIEK